MPAQRRKRLRKNRLPQIESKKLLIRLGLWLILSLVTLVVFSLLFGNLKVKESLVVNLKSGGAVVCVFDPVNDEITSVTIPAQTQLNLSSQLGLWRLGSVWQLGMNEKIGGRLLQESVVKNFYFPISHWADEEALGFSSGQPLGLIKATLLPYKSNLKLLDRLHLVLFAFKVKEYKKLQIDLAEGRYLSQVKLVDGEMGYLPPDNISPKFIALFSEVFSDESDKQLKVIIRDVSGKNGLSDEVGSTIQVLGVKVTSVVRLASEDLDCQVSGSNQFLVNKLAEVFNCQKTKQAVKENFDAEFVMGSQFSKRY